MNNTLLRIELFLIKLRHFIIYWLYLLELKNPLFPLYIPKLEAELFSRAH